MTAWATKDQARSHWPDAKSIADAVLDNLLDVATEQCQAYAPTLAVGATVPYRYTLATVYQAREVYAAGQRGEQDVIGYGDYAIRAKPITGAVKQMLRPQRNIGAVG